jgi:hypothetical protein
MKQEEMPIVRERFDRNKYQRELMRRRYQEKRCWAERERQDG